MREALLRHREQILHAESLARLREDASIAATSLGWEIPAPAAFESLSRLFEELEFKSLLTRLAALSR